MEDLSKIEFDLKNTEFENFVKLVISTKPSEIFNTSKKEIVKKNNLTKK
jgi:hypothetical protein